MELSSYVGRMSALKDEFSSIIKKSIDAETLQLKTYRVFMILTLLNLGLDFESIREQILIGPIVPTFDEDFVGLLGHSSTATQSLRYESTLDTSVMIS